MKVVLLANVLVALTVGHLSSIASASPLVSTAWLAAHLNDPSVRIVEIDDAAAPQYAKGHIPGAIGFTLQTQLTDSLRRDFLDTAALEKLAGRAGIGTDQTIVFYDSGGVSVGGLSSVYGYWLFKYRGAKNLAVLDGGLARWSSEGRSVTKDIPHHEPTKLELAGTVSDLRVFYSKILTSLSKRKMPLIDVRTRAEYVGELDAPKGKQQGIAMTSGHIPGANNILWSRALKSDGTFKSQTELGALYSKYRSGTGAPIVSYCLRGERGVVTWFVLHELLDQKRAALYDGSWTEWGNLVDVPVAR